MIRRPNRAAYRTVIGTAALLALVAHAGYKFDLPALPKPSRFGNILIDRLAERGGEKPVGFSHWSHRMKYTCRVCHFELDFAMEVNGSGITEAANQAGRFCGACHDGKTAFGIDESTCVLCHTGSLDTSANFKALKQLPRTEFGNRIDWTQAVKSGQIAPVQSILEQEYAPIEYTEELLLVAEWDLISPAVFPHEAHQQWLDCANCHPDIFNVKKKTTEHFEMRYNLEGKFCGSCHMRVAFPLDDCKRCHPKMKI